MNKTPEQLNKEMGFNLPIVWAGKAGYYNIDNSRFIKINLSYVGDKTDDHNLNAYSVTVINKETGVEIDANEFLFTDYLQSRNGEDKPYIARYRSAWWLNEPVSTKPIVDAIEKYIEVFK